MWFIGFAFDNFEQNLFNAWDEEEESRICIFCWNCFIQDHWDVWMMPRNDQNLHSDARNCIEVILPWKWIKQASAKQHESDELVLLSKGKLCHKSLKLLWATILQFLRVFAQALWRVNCGQIQPLFIGASAREIPGYSYQSLARRVTLTMLGRI